VNPTKPSHQPRVLTVLFQGLFEQSYRTLLVEGAAEPLYQPGNTTEQPHKIYFTHDYFASALHEIAHWCIAGETRRQQLDYGYWYVADGRSNNQQQAFEQVETKPQALEWVFCCAANFKFRISEDNLNGDATVSEEFKGAIWNQVRNYCRHGLPKRGLIFAEGLHWTFKGRNFLNTNNYDIETLA